MYGSVMSASSQTAAQTIKDVITWRPVLEPVMRVFEPLLAAQGELAGEMEGVFRHSGLRLPNLLPDRAARGVPLLAGVPLTGIAAPLRVSAEKLLPLMDGITALAPHRAKLEAFFTGPMQTCSTGMSAEAGDSRVVLVEALVLRDRETVARIAKKAELAPLLLEFVAGFIVPVVLRALTNCALPAEGEASWDEGDVWRQGYCPVCGALPIIGWLDKPTVDEKNSFLAGGGGKKHLHCGLCGANWKYRRGACPACGQEGSGIISILRESGATHGERLDWCIKCKSIVPQSIFANASSRRT
jgi:FdhE protein